jgi:methionyl-tRNA synthetase
MCGFTDVRKSAEGQYYCPHCSVTLPENFREQVEAANGKKMAQQLDKQCGDVK